MLGFGTIGQFAIGEFTAGSSPPIFADRWFVSFSEPVRVKLGLPAGDQQSFTIYPLPLVSFAWFEELSRPQKLNKQGLLTPLQQYEVQDTVFIPASKKLLEGWYNWLGEPVRLKLGLPTSEQQFLAYYPQLIPKPNVTGVMLAIGVTSDGAIFAVNVLQSQPAASAKVSIYEVSGGNSATSIRER